MRFCTGLPGPLTAVGTHSQALESRTSRETSVIMGRYKQRYNFSAIENIKMVEAVTVECGSHAPRKSKMLN